MNLCRNLFVVGILVLTNIATNAEPIKLAVIGLSHSHVHGLLGRLQKDDIEIVAIVEPNIELAKRFANDYKFSMNIVYDNMDEMLKNIKPEAVAAFGSIYEHLKVVETFAPLGIHVMVEKPLAANLEHTFKMNELAQKYNIQLLTNYETTWYATNHKAFSMIDSGNIGQLRKIVVHDGHKGPSEIGVNKEFLEWLTDPILNGGGAITDFGCYGANLITWLTKGERPESVIAVTQTFKPELYPNVDDEATIILKYPKMQGIIQASWNWPISRKDIEIYGKVGYVVCDNSTDLRFRLNENDVEHQMKLVQRNSPYNDPFSFFAAIINKEITMPEYDLSSLENNMIVMEILEAAKESAKTGTEIKLNK